MKEIFLSTLLALLLVSCQKSQNTQKLHYPNIEKQVAIDTIAGISVKDPYRNLENLEDSLVQDWFRTQGRLTDSVNSSLGQSDILYEQILAIESKAAKDTIIERYIYADDGQYFILKRSKDENIAKLYTRPYLKGPETLLVDPEKIKEGASINYLKLSPDFQYMAFAIAKSGQEVSTIYVLDVASKALLKHDVPEVMPRMAGGINWLRDATGFYYSKFPFRDPKKENYMQSSRSYLHLLSEPASKDQEVFSMRTNPEMGLIAADFPMVQTRNENSNILLARVSGSSPYKDMYYSEIQGKRSLSYPTWKPLFKQADQIDQYIIRGDSIWYRTSKEASNFKICKALIGSDYSQGAVVVPAQQDAVIVDFDMIGNSLYYSTIKNGVEGRLFLHQEAKSDKEVDLPFAAGYCYMRKVGQNLMVNIGGWITPTENYLYTTVDEQFSFVDLKKSAYPEFADFIVEEVEVVSHDGVKVPLSIVRHPDTKLNGTNRVKMNAYGAYGASSSPYLEIANMNWVAQGNIYALAHVRGGGEKGDAWHKGGFKTTKANSWKDFNACTAYLIDNKYTHPDKMIAFGVSAGGITIANALIERPDLYKVGLLFSGFVNASRSEYQPNGANSIKEFGTLTIPEQAKALVEMDAYVKIKSDVAYPSFYCFVGMEDGQVTPWDSGKFTARLQQDAITKGPVLLEVDPDGGHGGGGTAHDAYRVLSNMDAFALWQTGHPEY